VPALLKSEEMIKIQQEDEFFDREMEEYSVAD
jgi:hypothetical protein